MKIKSTTKINKNDFVLHYSYKDLKEFIARGKECGDCGFILISFINNFKKYKGFGTIDHPNLQMSTFNLVHHEQFDGKLLLNDILNPVEKNITENFKYRILNFNN